MLVLVGSNNPVKLKATEIAFNAFFPGTKVSALPVMSHVSEQPVNNDTFIGANNRARALHRINSERGLNADYFVGIEGGVAKRFARWFAFGCVCIIDALNHVGFGLSPHFELPESTIRRLLDGEELGIVVDEWSGSVNSKQKGGAIGYLTRGQMQRTDIYVQGLTSALVPFLNLDMYFEK
ncbi:inosine/xanthosine triphosphatase [candidate division KSB1 bacterium]|nr:inosine/xanthosine triphosphatase [candidate division KSB1 bacterium]